MNSQTPTSSSKYSLITLFLLVGGMLLLRLLVPRWDTHNVLAVLSWDVMGYYLYLPAVFIYGDLSQLAFVPDIFTTYAPSNSYYQAFPIENGNHIMKYTMGMSLCYLPFFLLGHLVAIVGGWKVDGFSTPYQFAIGVSAIFYAGLGLYLLRKVMLRYFPDKAAAMALFILVLGSNYVQYVSIDGAMPHGYLFTMYAAVIYLSMRWHESHKLWQAMLIGLLIGWSTLIRPTEVLMGIIPLFWGVTSVNDMKTKAKLIVKYRFQAFTMVLVAFLTVLPQLLYWKYISGDFVYYTYQNQEFDWMYPHFYDVLLGFRKGWLVYTPLMWLPLIGFFYLYHSEKKLFFPLIIFFLVNLYVVCSWSIWWYQGSYSCRALVQTYPILIIPLTAFCAWLLRHKFLGVTVGLVFFGLVVLTNFQLWQYNKGIIPANGASFAYYKAIFGKTSVTSEDLVLLDTDEVVSDESYYNKNLIAHLGMEEDSADVNVITGYGHTGIRYYKSTKENNFKKTISIKRSQLSDKPDTWLKLGVWSYTEWGAHNTLLVTSAQTIDKQPIKWIGVKLYNLINRGNSQWEYISYYYKLPPVRKEDYNIEIYILNTGETHVLWDDLVVEQLYPKKQTI